MRSRLEEKIGVRASSLLSGTAIFSLVFSRSQRCQCSSFFCIGIFVF
jgi:hypothetical protein